MSFDPRADPWGAAMLVCAAVAALGFLAIAIARVRGGYSGFGRVLMGLASVGFLGAAAVGTSERIAGTRTADAADATANDDAKAEPTELADAAAADAKAVDTKAETAKAAEVEDAKAEDAKAEDAKAEDAKAEDAKAEDAKAAEAAASPQPAPAPVASAEPLPTDGKARATAIWKMLRVAHLVADDAGKCEDPQEIATAWRSLAPLVADADDRGKAKAAIKKLEACRKKIVWARAYAIGRERLAKRDAFVDAIIERLAKRDIAAIAGVSGMKHEKLRVGGRKLDQPTSEALLAEGLKDELAEMGFLTVTLTDTKKSVRAKLEPAADAELAARELAAQGLDQPLALPK